MYRITLSVSVQKITFQSKFRKAVSSPFLCLPAHSQTVEEVVCAQVRPLINNPQKQFTVTVR